MDLSSVTTFYNIQQLHELAAEGNLTELKKAIAIDPSRIDCKDKSEYSLLHSAAKKDRLEVIEYLVSSGCNVDALDKDGQSPLHISAKFGHTESVKLLVGKKANVNQSDNHGNTPLHVAIMSGGDFGIAETLIQKANLSTQNSDNQNILHFAVKYHKVNVIKLILKNEQAHPLITVTDKDGLTPIHLAVSLSHFDTTEKLLKQPRSQVSKFDTTNQGKNIIHLAAVITNADLLSLLLDSHDTWHLINDGDNKLCTPLHDAANEGQLKQVEILMDNGAMIKNTIDGFSPLHCACLQGHLSVVKRLMERHPFQSNLFTLKEDTPLHLAAENGHAAIVKFLLDWGVLLTHNCQEASFLDLAISKKHFEVASVAVKHKRWQECLDFHSSAYPIPMIHLIQNIPEVVEIVMDHSITFFNPSEEYIYQEHSFTVYAPNSYKYIYTKFEDSTLSTKPLNVIRTMVEYKRNKLFAHPLLLAFVELQWKRYGKWYILFRAATLLLLAALLALLIFISDPPRKDMNFTEQLNTTTDDNGYIPYSLRIIIFLADIFYALVLILQAFFFVKSKKVYHPAHYFFEVAAVTYTAAFLFTDPTKWFTGISALFSAWLALSLFSRYIKVFGLYTIMFYELLFQVIKVLLVGLYYIIGFGLALYIIIGEERLYNHPIKAIYATFYASISNLNVIVISSKEDKNTLRYPISTYITLLVFNVCVSITLINFLIGIAVSKTKTIQKSALLYQAKLKVQLFLELDLIFPKSWLYKGFLETNEAENSGVTAENRFESMWNYFTNFFAYNDESQNQENCKHQKDHEMQEIIYRISQLENQIETILKTLTTNSKAT